MKQLSRFLMFCILVLTPLLFFTDLTRNPYYAQIVLLNALTVIVAMLWLLGGMKEGTLRIRRTPADLPLFAFLLVATVSLVVAFLGQRAEPYVSYGIYSEGLKRWMYLVVNAILPYYAAVMVVNDDNRTGYVNAVFLTAWIASAYGIFQYFGIEFIWPKVLNPYGGRCVSTFGNPNFLSSYLVMVMPISLLAWIAPGPALRRFSGIIVGGTCFLALLSTLTRSSWVGFLVAALVAVMSLRRFEAPLYRQRRVMLSVLGAAVIALTVLWPHSSVGGYSPSFMERLTETTQATTSYYGSWHQRRLIWSCAWHMVIENPVIGKGWGCFELFYPGYQGRHLFLDAYHAFRTHANNSHNEILEIWSQTGTLGLGVYFWLLTALFMTAGAVMRTVSGDKRILAIGLTAGASGMLVDNLLNVSLHFAVPGFLYWWQWGMLAGLGALSEKTVPVRSLGRKMLLLLLCAAGAVAVGRYYRSFLGEVHYFNGFKYSKRNDLQRAIPELEKAHRLQRLEVNNNYELANCYARAGMRDQALPMYGESLRANAGYDEIYFNMATVLAQTGAFERSISEYTRALYINPLSFDAYTALGSIFLQAPERYGAAGIALFAQCARFFPGNKDIWNNLGYLYTKTGAHERALECYKKALAIDPDFALARRNLSVALARLGRHDAGLASIDRLFSEAEQAIKGRDWAAAVTRCEKLVAAVPESPRAHLYVANAYYMNGRFGDAVAQYTETLRRDPRNLSALGNRALAYEEMKQYAAAKADFEAVLAIDRSNQTAQQHLVRIQDMLERALQR